MRSNRSFLKSYVVIVLESLKILEKGGEKLGEERRECSIREVGEHLKYKQRNHKAIDMFSCAACPQSF